MKQTCLALLLICAIPIASSGANFKVKVTKSTLYIEGSLSQKVAPSIEKFLKQGGNRIVITSEGGDVLTSIEIAKTIRSSKAELVVRRYCLSSCANYLFIAATKKSLEKDSVLGFHGAPLLASGQAYEAMPEALRNIILANIAFYSDIGVGTNFLKRSGELTRVDNRNIRYVIVDKGVEHDFSSMEAATDALASCLEAKRNCSVQVSSTYSSTQKAYFPSQLALENDGVTGITTYPYPRTQNEMRALAKKMGPDFELVGDLMPQKN